MNESNGHAFAGNVVGPILIGVNIGVAKAVEENRQWHAGDGQVIRNVGQGDIDAEFDVILKFPLDASDLVGHDVR